MKKLSELVTDLKYEAIRAIKENKANGSKGFHTTCCFFNDVRRCTTHASVPDWTLTQFESMLKAQGATKVIIDKDTNTVKATWHMDKVIILASELELYGNIPQQPTDAKSAV